MDRYARRSRVYGCHCGGFVIIVVLLIWAAKTVLQESIAAQHILRSRITNDNTSISGFYGPGAWGAWLITLGMTHGHMGMARLKTRNAAAEWDYDLIAAGGYIITASIDLIIKSRAITQLGEAASESPLLPALACAECVVSVGTGSSLFTVVTSGASGARRAGTVAVPLLFALVASFFVFRAHEAISRTAPVPWCRLHDGSVALGEQDLPFIAVDLPAWVLNGTITLARLYATRKYWLWVGGLSGVVVIVLLMARLPRALRSIGVDLTWVWVLAAPSLPRIGRRNLLRALRSAGISLGLLTEYPLPLRLDRPRTQVLTLWSTGIWLGWFTALPLHLCQLPNLILALQSAGIWLGQLTALPLPLFRWHNLLRIVRFARLWLQSTGIWLGVLCIAPPLLGMVLLLSVATLRWLCSWVFLWGPIYILAFCPQMGLFPVSGISVWEMDQIAALAGVAFIAAFRSFRRILEAAHPSSDSPSSSHELAPLLHTSSSPSHTPNRRST
ncbi:hypothetical protein B0H13DRAFT_2029121, partial [Mycena leptocephala]